MKKTKASILFILIFSLSSTVFANTALIENSGTNEYKSIRLTDEIYKNSNWDLSDILIKDQNGDNIPYFINSNDYTYSEEDKNYDLELINSYTKDDSFYFDYKLSNIPENDILSTSINLTTNSTDFAKKIELFGSYDNLHWEKIQDDTLYSVGEKSKIDIFFNKPEKYTHYRFKLANNLEKISFNTVTVKYNKDTIQKEYFSETIKPKFTTREENKETYIDIEGLKNLSIDTIIIETDSMFKREVSNYFSKSQELYNLIFDGTTYKDTELSFGAKRYDDNILTLVIYNNDDKPINITGITVNYYVDEIIFAGDSSSSYTLDFGVDPEKSSPIYDIQSYKDEILKLDRDQLIIKDINFEQPPEPIIEKDYSALFNIVIIVVGVVLGILILANLKKVKSE